jgi:hypothetical protein
MRTALIGYTGFVGSNLDAQLKFSHRYNSRNFGEMRGQEYDVVYCAGVQAKKWWANQHPEQDWESIAPLLEVLSTVSARQFALISTVDVYKDPSGVSEDTPIDAVGLHAYGLHRYKVELAIRDLFPQVSIIRLPGLFGEALKKNLINDVLVGNDLSGFDHRSSFQFYDLSRIGADIQKAFAAQLPLVNFAVEPVTVKDVMLTMTGAPYEHETPAQPHRYDMRTKHAGIWGRDGNYLVTKQECLTGIALFQRSWRAAKGAKP